jgi:hypothetical protein
MFMHQVSAPGDDTGAADLSQPTAGADTSDAVAAEAAAEAATEATAADTGGVSAGLITLDGTPDTVLGASATYASPAYWCAVGSHIVYSDITLISPEGEPMCPEHFVVVAKYP